MSASEPSIAETKSGQGKTNQNSAYSPCALEASELLNYSISKDFDPVRLAHLSEKLKACANKYVGSIVVRTERL